MQVFSIYYTRPLVGFFNQVLWPSVFRHFIRQLLVFSLEELINMSVSVGFFFFFSSWSPQGLWRRLYYFPKEDKRVGVINVELLASWGWRVGQGLRLSQGSV